VFADSGHNYCKLFFVVVIMFFIAVTTHESVSTQVIEHQAENNQTEHGVFSPTLSPNSIRTYSQLRGCAIELTSSARNDYSHATIR
jgi:hypothetical protein